MQGWIKLHRKIAENPIWQDKPFSRGQAWIDLLIMANHDDNTFLFDGNLVEVEKGSFITSELKLMNRWGWSKSKLRYFLFTLESQQMIVKNTDRKKTTITICKYCDYQISETTEKPLKDHRKTTERPLKDTNKNEKNEKNNIVLPYPLEEFNFGTELQASILTWLEYKNEKKQPYKPTGFKTLLGAIKRNSEQCGEQAVINLISECMSSNWQGIIWERIKKDNKPQSQYREI